MVLDESRVHRRSRLREVLVEQDPATERDHLKPGVRFLRDGP
jgi:hypothetical protein